MTATVLHIVQHLAPGGLETLVLEMQARDPNCHIVSLEDTADAAIGNWPRLAEHSERLHFLNKQPGLRLTTVWALRRLIRGLKPQAIHTHHIGPMLYGGLAARLSGISRWLHTEHDAWHLDCPRRARLVRGISAALRPRLVADADAVATRLRQRCGLTVVTIRNGIDTAKFAPHDRSAARRSLRLPEAARIIGTAGRMEPVKNQALLLEAFAQSRDLDDAILVLAGDGSQRLALEATAKLLRLGDRVRFLGRVDRMPAFLSALDLFVLPSDKEGYPLSLLEAQACGVPVLATDVGGSRDAVCPITGKMFAAGDRDGLADLLHCAAAPRATPRDFVLAEGSIDAMMASYARAYGL